MTDAPAVRVERLTLPASDADVRALAGLLVDAVHGGSAVSFILPFDEAAAVTWWQSTFASASARAAFFVARIAGEIVGAVQLHPAWAPNQPHRGDVAKLVVHRRVRGRGIARDLMRALEAFARADGYRLLTLDTRTGDTAERLYRSLGWTEVGVIPGYAVDPDGVTPHGTTIFYKRIGEK